MAEQTVLVCDHGAAGGRPCRNPASTYLIWREGDREAVRVDVCDTHAKALHALLAVGRAEDVPTKPRAVMEVTSLKPVKQTRDLKRKPRMPPRGP